MDRPLPSLGRFDHLEIGVPHPVAAAPQAAIPPPDKVLCLHCGQPNEKQRASCWACYRSLAGGPEPAKAAPPPGKGMEDITIVLDGTTYRSSDPSLPSDVKTLMDQIRAKGYSPELVAQWRSWRATRNQPMPAERPFDNDDALVPVENQGKDPLTGNEVFKGQRATVIRLDGKFYTSDDAGLTPEMRELFQYIESHGVTPELMRHLREVGSRAVVRPATMHAPTAEDLAFWKGAPPAAPAKDAAARDDQAQRFAALAVGAGVVALYILLRALAHP